MRLVAIRVTIKEKILNTPSPLSVSKKQITIDKTKEKIKNLKIRFSVKTRAKSKGVKNAKS